MRVGTITFTVFRIFICSQSHSNSCPQSRQTTYGSVRPVLVPVFRRGVNGKVVFRCEQGNKAVNGAVSIQVLVTSFWAAPQQERWAEISEQELVPPKEIIGRAPRLQQVISVLLGYSSGCKPLLILASGSC